jgi:hypothetical protein
LFDTLVIIIVKLFYLKVHVTLATLVMALQFDRRKNL